jgi:hypothetical protein
MRRTNNFGKLALRALPMALAAAAVAHATPNFNAPTTKTISVCPGFDTGSTGGNGLAGVVANSGHGLSLSGVATYSNPTSTGCVQLAWAGTGSGTFDSGTLPSFWDFTIATPGNVTNVSWNLIFTFTPTGGSPVVTTYNCNPPQADSPLHPGGILPRLSQVVCTGATSSSRNMSVSVPASLGQWEVDLQVTGTWSDSSLMTITVPTAFSVNINTPPGGAAVPALTPLALAIAAMGLLALGGGMLMRKKTAA